MVVWIWLSKATLKVIKSMLSMPAFENGKFESGKSKFGIAATTIDSKYSMI
jgi:hypothetical protein